MYVEIWEAVSSLRIRIDAIVLQKIAVPIGAESQTLRLVGLFTNLIQDSPALHDTREVGQQLDTCSCLETCGSLVFTQVFAQEAFPCNVAA